MYPLLTNVVCQFEDRNGKPLAGGKVFTYEANTTTPKITYADPDGKAPNTNPVILDQTGRAKIYADDGAYRVQVFNKDGVLIVDTNKISRYVTLTELNEFEDDIKDGLNELKNVKETLEIVTTSVIDDQKDQPGGLPGLSEESLIDATQLPNATLTTKGAVKLNNTLTSDSEAEALTAKMGKKLATEKLAKSDLGSGEAPIYAARAWVNFNGLTGAIRASGNIKSVTRTGVGRYAVVFDKEMVDENYIITTSTTSRNDAASLNIVSQTKSGFELSASYGGDNSLGNYDPIYAGVVVFR
ncbi:tail fiber protein [Acinetobacter radioresistens]|uniref:tail fiber protein n=1 Tax=Acinetobacter radioresistens TaxID=40216 RepID=UPI00200692BD|nr:tail fiber protein [Acinetobacter radioresistens]